MAVDNVIDAMRQPFLDIATDVHGSIVYLDAGAAEVAQLSLGPAFLLGRSLCTGLLNEQQSFTTRPAQSNAQGGLNANRQRSAHFYCTASLQALEQQMCVTWNGATQMTFCCTCWPTRALHQLLSRCSPRNCCQRCTNRWYTYSW